MTDAELFRGLGLPYVSMAAYNEAQVRFSERLGSLCGERTTPQAIAIAKAEVLEFLRGEERREFTASWPEGRVA